MPEKMLGGMGTPPGGGGEFPYKNDRDARRKFSKNTLEGTRISYNRRGSNLFLLLRGTNFKQHKTYSVIFFQLYTLKVRPPKDTTSIPGSPPPHPTTPGDGEFVPVFIKSSDKW